MQALVRKNLQKDYLFIKEFNIWFNNDRKN